MTVDDEDRETALMLAAQMKPASIAQMLGRSLEWVQAVLAPPVGTPVAVVDIDPPATVQPAKPAPVRWNPGHGLVLLKPVTDRVVRWAGWFVAAGWPVRTVAHLFDVDQDDLAAALQPRAAA